MDALLTPKPKENAGARKSSFFQAKLTVNEPGDAYEQEADAIADQVMRMPAPADDTGVPFKKVPVTGLQRKCAACEEEEKLHRKEVVTGNGGMGAPDIVSEVASGHGTRLDNGTRQFMESRMGQDFGNVQIHTDSRAAESAKSVNALAYTLGNHIVFNSGQYQPGTDSGKRLLAHELVHVGQQGSLDMQQRVSDTIQKQENDGAETDRSVSAREEPAPASTPSVRIELPVPMIPSVDGVMATAPTSLVEGPKGRIVELAPYTGNGFLDFPLAALEALGIPVLSYYHFHFRRARSYRGRHFESIYALSGGTSFIRNALHYGYITEDDVNLFGAPRSFNPEHYAGIPQLSIAANPGDIGRMINVSYFNYPLFERHSNPAILFSLNMPFDQNHFEAFANLGGTIYHALSGDVYNLPGVTHNYPGFSSGPLEQTGLLSGRTRVSPKSESGSNNVEPGLEGLIIKAERSGRPLPQNYRNFMEERMGAAFEHVNIHTDIQAEYMTTSLGARAFTVGSDIYFNREQWNPESREGKWLLAHELAHVRQQMDGGTEKIDRKIVVANPAALTMNSTTVTNQEEAEAQFHSLSPKASVDRAGQVALEDGTCDLPSERRHQCLCDLISTPDVWTVVINNTDWPHTVEQTLVINNRFSPFTYGVWGGDAHANQRVDQSLERVLGHELCGHAHLMQLGEHPAVDPDTSFSYGRPGHQDTVVIENQIADEIAGTNAPDRGLFTDPHQGESFARVVIGNFAFNSSDLNSSQDKAKIADAAALLVRNPWASVDIVGHSDPIGNVARISKNRARKVRSGLKEQGVRSVQIKNTVGQGDSECTVGADNAACRKVELFLYLFDASSAGYP